MRIKSDYKDYYDCGQQYGQDSDLLYIRKIEKIRLPSRFAAGTSGFGNLGIKYTTVGFCGKVYTLMHFSKSTPYYSTALPFKPVLCQNIEQVNEFIESQFDNKEIAEYYSGPPKGVNKRAKRHWSESYSKKSFEGYFEQCAADIDKHQAFFEEHNCPIFVVDSQPEWDQNVGDYRQEVILNACLRPTEFFRVFDPNTAFQELQMYLGNIAKPEKPIPQMSDRDQVGIHGFDKWSFRKMPEK